jgi:hypothetical protein
VNTGTRRSAIALWVALMLAGSILALMARGAGPLPGDLALTRWLQEWRRRMALWDRCSRTPAA